MSDVRPLILGFWPLTSDLRPLASSLCTPFGNDGKLLIFQLVATFDETQV